MLNNVTSSKWSIPGVIYLWYVNDDHNPLHIWNNKIFPSGGKDIYYNLYVDQFMNMYWRDGGKCRLGASLRTFSLNLGNAHRNVSSMCIQNKFKDL
jgi:hypothetical protein